MKLVLVTESSGEKAFKPYNSTKSTLKNLVEPLRAFRERSRHDV